MAAGLTVLNWKTHHSSFKRLHQFSWQAGGSPAIQVCSHIRVTWLSCESYELRCELVWNFLGSDVRMVLHVADKWWPDVLCINKSTIKCSLGLWYDVVEPNMDFTSSRFMDIASVMEKLQNRKPLFWWIWSRLGAHIRLCSDQVLVQKCTKLKIYNIHFILVSLTSFCSYSF